MIKKILVVLDTSKSSQRVRDMCINIAKNTNAEITGIGILDTPSLTTPYSEPLAGIAFNTSYEEDIVKQNHFHNLDLMKKFRNRIKKYDLQIKTRELEGDPVQEIENISHEHNLIIISKKTNFNLAEGYESDRASKKVARDNPRPTIVVPPYNTLELQEFEKSLKQNREDKNITNTCKDIIISYNGTISASRALHMFLLLNFWTGRKIHIVSIHEDEKIATDHCLQAAKICRIYDIKVKKHIIASKKSFAKIILNKAKELKTWMIVVGASKHNQIHDALFPSTTSILMRDSEVPLFIH